MEVADDEGSPKRSILEKLLYTLVVGAVLLVLLVTSLVSLGTFASKYNQIRSKLTDTDLTCILFAHEVEEESLTLLELSNFRTCRFFIWGQAAIAFMAFLWIGYILFQFFIVKIRVISILRIPDFLIFFLLFLLSFALSITITAGFNRTCSACQKLSFGVNQCTDTIGCNGHSKLKSSEASSWFASGFLLLLTILTGFLVVTYCIRTNKDFRTRRMAEWPVDTDNENLISVDAVMSQ